MAMRFQRHEREILKASRAEGYQAEIVKTGRASRLVVSDGKYRIFVPINRAAKGGDQVEHQVENLLKQVRRSLGEAQRRRKP